MSYSYCQRKKFINRLKRSTDVKKKGISWKELYEKVFPPKVRLK